MTEAAGLEPGTRRFGLPWQYRRRKLVGRCIGAIRVLLGKSASVPKGSHNTSIGPVEIDDYYGGLIFSVGGRDNYWKANGYDGSGASMCG